MTEEQIDKYILEHQIVTWERRFAMDVPFDITRGTVAEDYDGEAWETVDGFAPMSPSELPGEIVSLEWKHEWRMLLDWRYAGHRILLAKVRNP